MSGTSSVSTSVTFIDLATYSELEGFVYGGPEAITWFVASVQKANWFSYVPISLRHTAGNVDFGAKNVAASVNRSGDYVIHVWFRAQIPQIELYNPLSGLPLATNASIRWTRYLMHNLFEKINISFNELVVQEFDNFWLDFNFQFRTPTSKRTVYNNMVGNIDAMTSPVGVGVPLGTGGFFSVPFPFFFAEDSGIALPVAALPFNDIKINYNFRRWQDLVMIYPGNSMGGVPATNQIATVNNVRVVGTQSTLPSLQDPMSLAHYAVVHNDERVKMGDAPRDILIHQTQATQLAPFKDVSTRSCFDIRFSHAIVLFMYAAQNYSLYNIGKGIYGAEWSNYTTQSAMVSSGTGPDPIAYTTLLYENTPRLAMGSDYFALMQPFLLSTAAPSGGPDTGYHLWTYSLKPWDATRPAGSTNYSKLANVSIQHDMSPAAQNAAGVNGAPVDYTGVAIVFPESSGQSVAWPQVWNHILEARNWNIARVANGSLGHPTL